MTREKANKILLVADIIVAIILVLVTLWAFSCDADAKTKEQVAVEKYISKYAKKKHKAKGVRYVGERGATKKVIRCAKNKKCKKHYKKDVVERFQVKIIDRYGAYITVDRQKGGFIDGVKDDWKPGTKVWIYKVYKWKTGKCTDNLLAVRGL